MFPLHYTEAEKSSIPLDINFDQYILQEKNGYLHLFTARNNKELIGYILGFIRPHSHNKVLTYFNDCYYVKNKYRNNGIGTEFFKQQENDLNKLNVKRIIQFTKLHNSHQKLFESLGYTLSDIVVTKIL